MGVAFPILLLVVSAFPKSIIVSVSMQLPARGSKQASGNSTDASILQHLFLLLPCPSSKLRRPKKPPGHQCKDEEDGEEGEGRNEKRKQESKKIKCQKENTNEANRNPR